MKKFVVAPDSFKGTMTAARVCQIIAGALQRHFPGAHVAQLPMADGGEGTVESFCHALRMQPITAATTGPCGQALRAQYACTGDTAVLETASAAGLHLAASPPDPGTASTYGVGILIRHAVERGCRQILLGLGGSCTNDGGAGMAAALGVKFYDQAGTYFVPVGETLGKIARIHTGDAMTFLQGVQVVGLCDVDNPLCGKEGAAYVYAPQKGAGPQQVKQLDDNLRHYAGVLQGTVGVDYAAVPGAGAAGGLGVAILALLQGRLCSGIQTLMDEIGLEDHLQGADLLITGEGRLDSQSVRGKVIDGVASMARKNHVPVLVLAGCLGEGAGLAYDHGVDVVFSTISKAAAPQDLPSQSIEDMTFTADAVARFIKLMGKTKG